MIKLKKVLNQKLKNSKFKESFTQEKKLINLALKIKKTREKKGISQQELAEKAHVTQQQLSKIENALNCNINTFLKVTDALKLKVSLF